MPPKAGSPSIRTRSLAAVHQGKRQLGWDDEIYRAFLQQAVGKVSARDCTDAELARVLDAMRQRGYGRKDGTAPSVPRERATQLDKARALWAELTQLGELHNPTEAGFAKYVERMTRRSRPEWCNPEQLSKVIEGLKAMHQRATARCVHGTIPVAACEHCSRQSVP